MIIVLINFFYSLIPIIILQINNYIMIPHLIILQNLLAFSFFFLNYSNNYILKFIDIICFISSLLAVIYFKILPLDIEYNDYYSSPYIFKMFALIS